MLAVCGFEGGEKNERPLIFLSAPRQQRRPPATQVIFGLVFRGHFRAVCFSALSI